MSATLYEVSASTITPGVSDLAAKEAHIRFDSSPTAGHELPGPAELLCGAFAACLLKNVERFSQLLHFTQHGASVRVVAERQDAPPMFTRIRYDLRVITDEPRQRLDLLQRNLAKYGTVYNTLARVCDVDGDVVAEAPEPAARPT